MQFLSINWNPDGTLFDLGFFQIRYYSLMFVIAFLLGWYVTKQIFIRENLSLEKLDKLFIYAVVAILLGARLGHVIFYDWSYFQNHLAEILLPIKEDPNSNLFGFIKGYKFTGFTGLASHGAAIGVIIAMFIYKKKVLPEKSILWLLDRVVLSVSLGAIFVRIGNFMNSEIIGKPTETDYGVVFQQLGENFPRHPAQLYESFGYIFVFLILMYVYWKTEKRNNSGFLFGLFLILLWSVRFIVEFFKENQVEFEDDMAINMGQTLSIPFILAGIYFVIRSLKKQS